MNGKAKKLILTNLPYLLIGLFATNIGLAWRLTPGVEMQEKVANIGIGFAAAFQSIAPSFHPTDLCVGLGLGALLRYFVYAKGKNAKKYRKNVEYGSARWGTPADIQPYMDPVFKNNMILTQSERLTMNNRPKNPKTARNKNVLIIGGSGSGKTRFWLTPNLMQCHSSYIITDPKGTLLAQCGKLLEREGYHIKVLNTINFSKSMKYNPFAYINSEKDILKLVTTIISNTTGEQKGGDSFWEKSETLLLTALIAYLYYEAPTREQTFSAVLDYLGAMETREDDEDFANPVDQEFEKLELKNPNHFAVRQYKKFKLAAGKTAKSILISCGVRLAAFDIQELRELTAYDELELDTLGDRKTALFIITSDTDKTFDFVTAMVVSQMFNTLCTKADDVYGGRLPIHVRCLLDEFANIKVPDMQRMIAVFRSREISACMFVQAQSQLRAIYKDHCDTVVGNCDCTIFLGGKEPTTLKELSAALGKETIDAYNTGESRGREKSYSLNYQKLGKDLMTVDELAAMDGGKCVLQLRGVRPFLSDKYDLTQHPNYKYLSDADPRNTFDIGKFLSRKLKVRPNDQYEVFEIDLSEEAAATPD